MNKLGRFGTDHIMDQSVEDIVERYKQSEYLKYEIMGLETDLEYIESMDFENKIEAIEKYKAVILQLKEDLYNVKKNT